MTVIGNGSSAYRSGRSIADDQGAAGIDESTSGVAVIGGGHRHNPWTRLDQRPIARHGVVECEGTQLVEDESAGVGHRDETVAYRSVDTSVTDLDGAVTDHRRAGVVDIAVDEGEGSRSLLHEGEGTRRSRITHVSTVGLVGRLVEGQGSVTKG